MTATSEPPRFRFACTRSGRCCSGGRGHVWLADGEAARLARALGADEASFLERHARVVADPATGERRLALREDGPDGGRCSLLVGASTCSAYEARPAHCRAFPFWPRVLAGGAAFEEARATCPGIAVEVAPALAARAFDALEELYARVGGAPPGRCCLAGGAEAELFATGLEADHAVARGAPDGRCELGPARPLGCRLADAPADEAERRHRELRALERSLGYPASYARLADLLRARREGAASPRDAAEVAR